jgi:hypothetical protein
MYFLGGIHYEKITDKRRSKKILGKCKGTKARSAGSSKKGNDGYNSYTM